MVTQNPANPIKKVPSEYDLKGLLDLVKTDILLTTNCHGIAVIQSFDETDQTVQATMAYKKTVNGQQADYHLMIDMPVMVLTGGTARLELPIAAGDEALICFNDRDIDNWFSSGQLIAPATSRLHAFTDGIAIVGLHSKRTRITDFDMDHASLVNGAARVAVSETKILIENETTDLKTVLNGILDLLVTAFGTNTPTVGTPINPTAATALTAYKTTVGGLLE